MSDNQADDPAYSNASCNVFTNIKNISYDEKNKSRIMKKIVKVKTYIIGLFPVVFNCVF